MPYIPLTGETLTAYNNLASFPPTPKLGDVLNTLQPSADGLVFVDDLNKLPSAVGGVITLADDTAYWFTQNVDLLGARLVAGEDTTILGSSSENVRLKSTGLVGAALITSQWSLPMRFIAIEADIALDLDGGATPNGKAIDWFGVNFVDCATVGRIANYNNFIMADSAFLNAGDLTFDGALNTIGFSQCLFNPAPGQTSLVIPSTLTIGRRLRVVYSSFVVLAGEVGVDVDVLATVPAEGYILDTVNFSGGGTYTQGVLFSDNKSQFVNCRGVPNSSSLAQYNMSNNAVATVISGVGTFTQILGATVSGAYVQRFTLTDNNAEYTGVLEGFFDVTAVGSVSAQNNREVAFRVAVNGVTVAASEMVTNSEGVGRSAPLMTQAVVQLTNGADVSIYVANLTDGTNITVSNLNVSIETLS